MEMPDAVKWLLPIVVGESWPEGDEDKLRELRDAWHNASKAIQPIADTATKGATEVLGGWSGQGAEKFAEAWKKFVEGDEAYFKSLADSSKALGDSCNATALDVEYTKYMIIISLVILAAQIVAMIAAAAVTFGGSTAGIAPAQIATRMTVQMIFRQLMQKLAQEGFKKVAKELLEKLLKEGLKKIGKEVLQNTAMNLAMDAGIQGLQMAKGDRDSWDFSKTKDSAISGAVDGVVGAGSSSIGKGATKGLSDSVGGQIVDSAARGAVRGAAEGVASTVGQAAVTGDLDKLSAKDVLMGASGGAVGGGVDGAKSQIGDIKAANTPGPAAGDGPTTPDVDSGDSGTPSRTPGSSDSGSSSRSDSSSSDSASSRSDSDSSSDSSSRSDSSSDPAPRSTSDNDPSPRSSSADPQPQRAADGDRVSQSSTQAPERPADTGDGQRAAQTHQNAPVADNGSGQQQQQQQAAAGNQQQAPAAQSQAPAQAPAASPAQTPASSPAPAATPAPSSSQGPASSPAQGPASSPAPSPSHSPSHSPSPSPSQSSAMPPAASSGAPSSSGGYGMASGSSAPSGGYGMAPGGNPPGNGPAPGGFPPGGHDPSRPPRPNDGVQAAGLAGNGGPQQPRFDQPPAPMPFQGQQPMQPPPPGGFAPPPPPPPGGGGGPMPHRGQQGPMGPRPTGPQPPPPGQGGHPQDRGPRQRPQQPPQPPPPPGPPRPPQGYQGRPGPGPNGGVPPRPQTPPPGPPPGNRGPGGYPPPPPRPQHPGNGPFPGNRGPMPPPPPGHHPGQPGRPGQQPGRPMPPGAEPPRFGGPQRPPQVPAPRPGHDGNAGPQQPQRPPQQQQPPVRPVEHAPRQVPQDHGATPPKDTELPKDTQAPKDVEAPKDTETPKDVESPKDADTPKDADAPNDVDAPKDTEAPTPDDRATVDEPYLTDPDFHTDDPAAYRALAETQIDKRGFDKDTGEARSEQVRREGLAKRDAHEDPRVKQMSDQGAYAVHSYTRTDMAERITHAQRHGGPELDALRPHIEAITSGLNEMPAYEGLVSRRVNFNGNESAIRAFLEAHAKGQVMVDPQMLSTSRVTPDHPRSTFPGEVEMRIQSKTGRHIEDLASKKDEREVLMKSATQLRVTDVKMGPGHPEHPDYKKRLDDGSPNDLPKWIVECEEVVPGDDGHLSPDEVHQKVAERRDYNNAVQERLAQEAADQEAQLRREHPELFQGQGLAGLETKLADGKGGWTDVTDAPVRELPKPPREHAPDGGWSELAKPLEEGGTPVIHAGSTETPHQQLRLVMDELPAIGEANTRNYYAPESWKDGYQTNSAEALVAFENRMEGGDAVAGPSTGGSPLQHVSDRLGGQWSDRNGFADVARELGERPVGARTAVAFEHHAPADPNAPEGSPRSKDRIETRIVAAVNTPHGVVFADPMTGRLATLPDDPTSIKAMPMGGGDAPHVHSPEAPETTHTDKTDKSGEAETPVQEQAPKTEVDIAERLKGPEETPARLDESYLGDENFRGTPEDHKSLRDRYDSADLAEQAREKALRRLEASPLKDRVSPEAAEAIYSYSREHAYAINEANRRGESHPDFENAQRSTRAIVGALNELPDFHGEAIRGIDTKGDMQAAAIMAAHYEPGQTVPEPTMTSSTIKTSPDTKSKFGQDVEIHIVSKTGKDVSSLAENPGEHEAINKPATQLYVHSKEFKTPPLVDRPKWVIHAEEVTPGDPRYLDPETAKQKMDERRARHAAEAPELARLAQAQSMARLGGFDEPQTPHLTAENPAEHGVADADKGPEYGEQPAQDHSATDDTAELPVPERDYSSMAVATNPPSEPAIHAGSASREQQAAYIADRHPRLGEVNPHFNDPDALANGYRSNCTRTPGAYMDRLNGIDSTADPLLVHEMDSRGTLEHVEERFGGQFSDRADYDAVIREMRGMPTDHHAVVAVKYLDENGVERGHVAMVANTRDGVAFLDPQSGALMNLPHPPLGMKLMHVGVPEGPAAQHTDGHTTQTETSSTRPVDPRIAFARPDQPAVDPRIAFAREDTPDVQPSRIGPDGRPIVTPPRDAGYGMASDEPSHGGRADVGRFLNDPEVAAAVDGLDPDKKRAVHEDENGVKHDVGPMRDFIREHLPAHPELVRLMEHPDNAYLRASLLNNPMTIGSLLLHPEAIPILEDALRDVEERGHQMIDDVHQDGPGDTPLTQEQRDLANAAADIAADVEPGDQYHAGFDRADKGDTAKIQEFLDAERAAWPQNQGDLNRIAERIAADNNGESSGRPGPKDDDRAKAKIEGYDGDASKLTDLVGVKIQFDTLADVYNALNAVMADPDLRIVSFDDRFANPQDSGYRDLQMNVRLPNGHVAELRLHLRHIDTVSAYEHALYEVRRDFPTYNRTLDADNKKRLSPEQALLEAALMDRVREKFMAGLRKGLPPEEST
ncbi:NAD:arginine ADP-ribosyltransferase [Amycolatopsis sp. MJM2582]|uniref:WXG100-like domain-containing protein n=1 Tax=Amycolatopsis sp. MJM2582 TaxID=1427749 RepID=UPI0005022CAE|nr:toxin glutamine deamidase domain-containing protein [Amycolatopsis sp. MJM2582]KFZ83541.1 NAD:arginine ADP-ribosyltransferase [Amycolatopsis sp. MJM2582]